MNTTVQGVESKTFKWIPCSPLRFEHFPLQDLGETVSACGSFRENLHLKRVSVSQLLIYSTVCSPMLASASTKLVQILIRYANLDDC